MSKQANKTLIGVFVIGAMVLLTAGVLIFGSVRLLHRTLRYVAFFDGSVKGLVVGAPVMFRGVAIGEVTQIRVYSNPRKLEFRIPVIMEIYPERIEGAESRNDLEPKALIGRLIEKGLRAQLQLQSLLTSRLFIQLDFYGDKPAKLFGLSGLGLDRRVTEIPTITSSLEEISKTLQNLSLEEIATSIQASLQGIEKFINSPELAESILLLPQTLADTRAMVSTANSRISALGDRAEALLKDMRMLADTLEVRLAELTRGITATADSAQTALVNARQLIKNVDREMGSLHADLLKTTATTRDALQQAQKTLENVDSIIAENSGTRYNLDNFLIELTYAAQSLRSLIDILERNPEALLRGKGNFGNPGGN